MPSRAGIPTRWEIEQQLARMRESARFRTAQSQADLLTMAVMRTLNGESRTEDDIGKALFPQYTKDESSDVRVTASNLRKTMRRYYAMEGHADLVTIALPEPSKDKSLKLPAGAAYTPAFSYNPRHSAMKEFRLGEYYLHKRGKLRDIEQAVGHYSQAIALYPTFWAAYLGLAEILCFASSIQGNAEQRSQWLSNAETAINGVLHAAPKFWRVHLTRAVWFKAKHDLASAEAEFEIALSLDAPNTQASIDYTEFLVDKKRISDALQLAESHLDEQVDDPTAHVIYGIYLMDQKRFAEAEQVMNDALKMDEHSFVTRMGMIILKLSTSPDKAMALLSDLKPLIDERTYEFVMRNVRDRLASDERRAISPGSDSPRE